MFPSREFQSLGFWRISLVFLGMFWAISGPGESWAQDLFTVRNISVDEVAETAADARRVAIAKGQRQGIVRLFRKITRKRDVDLIPTVDATTLEGLVRGFEVQQEKTSATRYLALLTVHFDQSAVRAFLRQTGIPFTETSSKPYLVLPVYEVAGTQVLWEEPNPWRRAWVESEAADSIVPLIVPAGDLQDVVGLSAAQAVSGDEDRITKLTKRYGVDQAFVAHAKVTFALGSGEPSLVVTTYRYGVSGDRMSTEAITGQTRDQLPGILRQAVAAIRSNVEEEWKGETALAFDRQGQISLNIPLENLRQWVDIRKRLEMVAEINQIELASITKADAQTVIHYFGNPEKLRVALSQRDLELTDENGYWILRPRGAEGGSSNGQAAQQ